jgi:hypothetical protein
MRPVVSFAVLLAWLPTWTETALACPRCAAGQAARQQVLEGFSTNLAIMLLPFMVVGLLSAWLGRR